MFLGTWLRVPQRVLFECFLRFWGKKMPKSTQKALFGALGARCSKTLRKHSGPLSTTPIHHRKCQTNGRCLSHKKEVYAIHPRNSNDIKLYACKTIVETKNVRRCTFAAEKEFHIKFRNNFLGRGHYKLTGQRTEHAKTEHVKTDRFCVTFVGTSVGTLVGRFGGAFHGESSKG